VTKLGYLDMILKLKFNALENTDFPKNDKSANEQVKIQNDAYYFFRHQRNNYG